MHSETFSNNNDLAVRAEVACDQVTVVVLHCSRTPPLLTAASFSFRYHSINSLKVVAQELSNRAPADPSVSVSH